MRITVLGSGNGGTAAAFDWASHGHEVALWDFPQFGENIAAIAAAGAIRGLVKFEGSAPVRYAGHDLDAALDGTPVTYDGVNYYQLASQTSGTDGVVKFDSLRADGTFKYVVVETTVPDGYKAVDPIFVQLPLTSGGSTFTDLTYTAIDYKKVVLPGTGGVGALPYAFVGVTALALMALCLRVINAGEGGDGERG